MSLDRSALDELRIDRKDDVQPSGRRKIIIPIIALAVIAVALFVIFGRGGTTPVKVAAVTEEATGSGGGAVLNASGYVTARRQATISSKVTGRVIEVLVEEGMPVQQGQVMARIDAINESAIVRLAEAQVDAARSALEETRVRISEAQLDYARAANLAKQNIASTSDLDRARAQVRALEARLTAQRDQLTVSERQLRIRQQDLNETTIRAPFAGVVVSKNAQPGEIISPMSAGGGFTRTGICTIVDMDSLEVEVDVNESYINRVSANQRVTATLDSYADWQIPAHVIAVIPTADRQKATVKVRIAFDQRDVRILPDMGVKVAFAATEGAKQQVRAKLVPRAAVRREGDRDVVFVVNDSKLERRAVVVTSTDGDKSRIASGVAAGETVVIGAEGELKDGQRVHVEEEKKK